MRTKLGIALVLLGALAGATACDGTGVQGQDQLTHEPNPLPPAGPGGTGATTTTAGGSLVGPSCSSGDPQHICLALRYVVYDDSSASAVVSQDDAIANVDTISRIWSSCNIGFQIEDYMAVQPANYGLNFSPADDSELDRIRYAFDDSSTLLVATTGAWNRSGTLGRTPANAWTNMPGDAIYGSILEAPVGNYPNIIAHELGHYLNLAHVSDTSDLMNPIIYSYSTALSQAQCSAARAAAAAYWRAMYR